jgi:polysaccharide export outer membrane protein
MGRAATSFLLAIAVAAAALARTQAPPSENAPQDPPLSAVQLGPGDVLGIEVLGVEELSRSLRVQADGTIKLPVVGVLQVAGLVPRQVEALLARALEDRRLVNEPAVSVFVEEYVSQGVMVRGAVVKPGDYQIVGGKTLFDVLFEAGGIAEGAREVVIIRKDEEGRRERLTVDAVRLYVEGDLAADVDLVPGDIVMVSRGRRAQIFVTGAVSRQGAIEFDESQPFTVLQAITAAGGSGERAKLANVHVLRRMPDGSVKTFVIDLKKVRRGKEPDLELEPNDTVVVGERFF